MAYVYCGGFWFERIDRLEKNMVPSILSCVILSFLVTDFFFKPQNNTNSAESRLLTDTFIFYAYVLGDSVKVMC